MHGHCRESSSLGDRGGRRKRSATVVFAVLLAVLVTIAPTQAGPAPGEPRLAKDVAAGPAWSIPDHLTALGETLFFTAEGSTRTGRELWKSDALGRSVVLVKDIYPGHDSSISTDEVPNAAPPLVAAGDRLFFAAADGRSAFGSTWFELWTSDGTEEGTVLVRDINPGGHGALEPGTRLAAVGETVYFAAHGPGIGSELWKSDGTEAGTRPVRDIALGPDSSGPRRLTALGDTLFFAAAGQGTGHELWKSDGSESGTVLVRDINPGPESSTVRDLTAVGSTLFFTATVPAVGCELWKSEPPYTAATTSLVRDINPNNAEFCSPWTNIRSLTAFAGELFFAADDGVNGRELWKSDGTAAGTVMVHDIWPGPNPSWPQDLTVMGDSLFFSGSEGGEDPPLRITRSGRELWKSDGTAAGTVRVKEINPGDGSSYPGRLTAVGNELFFTAFVPGTGYELWRSDGSESGTALAADIRPGDPTASPGSLTALGNTLFFAADEEKKGRELWMAEAVR